MSPAGRGRFRTLRRLTSSLSFRIVILFAGFLMLSGILVILLSGWRSQRSLEGQIRRAATTEQAEALSAAGTRDLEHLLPVVRDLVRHEPDFFYLLQDGSGHVMAGNMLNLRPVPGSRWLSRAHRRPFGEANGLVYGQGLVLVDGGYFFVGIDASPLRRLRHEFRIVVGWSLVGFAVLGVGGGLILSAIILGRIETIGAIARRIMNGDLSQRIPHQGANDEFDDLAHALNAMLERNERLIASLQQVSNDIAHDMRRPLSRLRQRLEAASVADHTPDAFRATIEDAVEDLDSALEIFSSLLRLSQIEAAISTGTVMPVAVGGLVREVVDLFRPVAEDRGQALAVRSLDSGPVSGTVMGDPVLLMQMLSNLVENAINHTPHGSHITVGATLSGDRIMLVVADDGAGIPPDSRERVFHRFVRLDDSRSVPGSGLGLSLVRAIVRLHGGTIALSDNRPGLRCTVILPHIASIDPTDGPTRLGDR
ncbi:putative two-component sensor histidine kinase [Gluconacetobacter diazotrophicus PA1 5]|uniref:histidine kinase n=2 Tax=Gluconacetobacter diazotrophicus TaxID=33996 RepID=A9H950_GLUDA|nr:putative two-component sensor histidine kinase [Gluconacetobacter diazotrophicus PA1 5]